MSTCNCILKSNSPYYFRVWFADPRNITNGFRSNCELMWPQTRCYFWNISLLLSLIHDISILLYLTANLDSSCIHVNVFHCELLFYRISEFPGKNFFTVWIDLSDQFQISPAALPEILTTHSMKNLTFHSLRGWKMTYYQFWLTHVSLLEGIGGMYSMYFLNLGVKGVLFCDYAVIFRQLDGFLQAGLTWRYRLAMHPPVQVLIL